jgi:hypothetical protein
MEESPLVLKLTRSDFRWGLWGIVLFAVGGAGLRDVRQPFRTPSSAISPDA